MIRTALLVGSLLAAGPALAQQDGGNVGQPSRGVPQTGQTTGGPLENSPGADRSTAAPSSPGPGSSAGAVDSAKGGNANENDKAVPNTGAISGGPAR